jgi:ribosome-binding protein aMBF1 (putative translation factor)
MGRRDSAHAKRLIAKYIRRMRLAKSWSQHDLANEAGTRRALISSLEAGEANPTRWSRSTGLRWRSVCGWGSW